MGFVTVLLGILLFLTAIFLIVLVLIQRGKGGGLAGAFGGMGGQSAFGTKAGDLFTRITIGVAAFWIVLCIIGVKVFGIGGQGPLAGGSFGSAANKQPGASAPANTGKAAEGGKGGAPAPVTPPRK
jgi:preprotein translocase subunit SecG